MYCKKFAFGGGYNRIGKPVGLCPSSKSVQVKPPQGKSILGRAGFYFLLFVSILLSPVFITSCCNNVFADILLRTYDDPFDEAPDADWFSEEKKIFISWTKDEGADEYILFRAEDSLSPQYEQIYRGKGLSFTDTLSNGLNVNQRYLYKLDKTRGRKTFYGQKKAYAYCCDRSRDIYDNNTEEKMIKLTSDIDSLNLYYGRFCDGTVIYEEDFFYVVIPPHRQAELVLERISPASSTTNYINYRDKGLPEQTFPPNALQLENRTSEEQVRKIMLCLDSTCVTGAGLYIVTYNFSLANISKYQN